jgi:hypothetical protein
MIWYNIVIELQLLQTTVLALEIASNAGAAISVAIEVLNVDSVISNGFGLKGFLM